MLHVKTFKWGDKYTVDDVHKVAVGFARHLKEPHHFECITDTPHGLQVEHSLIRDSDLLNVKGCFARLRLFDPEYQAEKGIIPGERIVCVDLDVVITGDLFPLFFRPEPFLILQGANAVNPCKFNGSLWMLRAGYRPDVWTDFSLDAAGKVPFFSFPDDQGWLWHKIPDGGGWQVGSASGVYAFQKKMWPEGNGLPLDARMVVFPGWRSPTKFRHLDWIKKHWIT